MNDLHIHDFCRDTAKVLLKLYAKFPQKIILYVEDFAGADTPDEFGLHSPRFIAGFDALRWLAEADYIQFSQTVQQEAVEEATLTHRCFTYLAGPDTETEKFLSQQDCVQPPTLTRRIDALRDCIKSKSSDHLTELVLKFMRESRQH